MVVAIFNRICSIGRIVRISLMLVFVSPECPVFLIMISYPFSVFIFWNGILALILKYRKDTDLLIKFLTPVCRILLY